MELKARSPTTISLNEDESEREAMVVHTHASSVTVIHVKGRSVGGILISDAGKGLPRLSHVPDSNNEYKLICDDAALA
ncbi:uncharacterized protein ARMOST_20251 [Armillaria ostoyae]|uniref:Uncharacterized protein n=1 Tax=Armillaria ostoyae TaxID=47428 RepID=A0A284S6S4_ARMOS|nr:uncharacterized protein ARMOST_20251 [Armillaria ostoyae]